MNRDYANCFGRLKGVAPVVLAALLASGAAMAQDQASQAEPQTPAPPPTAAPAAKIIPDAQIEASVLKALASAPDLANQAITTTTVYGAVTLSGSVETEALRVEAENLAARTVGVKKVIDEMTLGTQPATASDAHGTNPQLQSDGTLAPQQQEPTFAALSAGAAISSGTALSAAGVWAATLGVWRAGGRPDGDGAERRAGAYSN